MAEIFNFGKNPIQDKWTDRQNIFHINDMDVKEWANLTSKERESSLQGLLNPEEIKTVMSQENAYKGYWQVRDILVNKNAAFIEHMAQDPQQLNLDRLMKTFNMQNASNYEQVLSAKNSWLALIDMQKGIRNGSILGFDTETFGDIIHAEGHYGITELAFGSKNYIDGIVSNGQGFSLAVGIDEKQKTWMLELVDKYKTNGWDNLEKSEQITLQRMSMAGFSNNLEDIFEKTKIKALGGKEMTTIKNLAEASMSPDVMIQGINNWYSLYENGVTSKTVLPEALKILNAQVKSNNPIAIANSNFDYGAIEKVGKQIGLSIDTSDYLTHTTDLTYVNRAAAAVNNQSVSTMTKKTIGIESKGATVQSLIEALEIGNIQTHIGYKDVENELNIIDYRNFYKGQSYAEYLFGTTSSTDVKIRQYNADTSVFLLNHGWLDKNKKDFAVIDGKATQSYSINGQYWTIDAARTGEVDGKWYLTMQNAEDIRAGLDNVTRFTKEFDSFEDMIKFRDNNMQAYTISQINGAKNNSNILQNQTKYHYEDFGRKEFDKLINASEIRTEWISKTEKAEVYGFNSMEKMLGLLNDKEIQNAIKSNDLSQKGGYHKTYSAIVDKFDSSYEAQAFLGMYEKLTNEQELISDIVKKVNGMVGSNADNVSKTLAFRNAYDEAKKYLGNKYITSSKKREYLIASDVFGIDVKIDESRIARINAYDPANATKDVSRIFGSLSKNKQIDIINNLKKRNILTQEQASGFIKSINNLIETNGNKSKIEGLKSVTAESNPAYQIYEDIGYALNSVVEPFKDADGSIVAAFKSTPDATNKNLISLTQKSSDEITKYRLRGSSEELSLGQAFKGMEDKVSEITTKAISQRPTITHINGKNDRELKTFIEQISDSLNLGNDLNIYDESKQIGNVLESWFTATNTYGLNQYDTKGLHTMIINPGNQQSAFMLVTKDEDYTKLIQQIGENAFDFRSYGKAIDSGITESAMIVEMPYINRYGIDEKISDAMQGLLGKHNSGAEITTIKQGENFEKFLISQFNVYRDKETNAMKGYISNGVADYYRAFTLSGGNALTKLINGETTYKQASRSVRSAQNAKLKDLSSSSSYRGYINEATGELKRYTNYGPGDYIYAYEVRAGEKMHEIFNGLITDAPVQDEIGNIKKELLSGKIYASVEDASKDIQYSQIDAIIDTFGIEAGIFKGAKESSLKYRYRVSQDNRFNEFFQKNLFQGKLTDDELMSSLTDMSVGGQSIFETINSTIQNDNSGLFDDSIKKALNKIDKAYKDENINQLLSHTAMEKGIWSLIKPGEFDDNAGLYSTMRPTYLQQNLGILFDPTTEWDQSITSNFKTVKLNNGKNATILGFKPGSAVETKLDNSIRELLSQKDYKGKTGISKYSSQKRHIMSTFGQVSDYDLQMKYAALLTDNDFIQNNLVNGKQLSEKQMESLVNYVRQDMMSVNEGKWFMDPKLAEQKIISQADLKKVSLFNPEDINVEETEKILTDLIGKDITVGTVVGKTTKGADIVFDQTDIRIAQSNIKDFLDPEIGESLVVPVTPDVIDKKFMANGAEKATVHAISVTKFMEYADTKVGLKGLNHNQALELASNIFNYISNGAGVIGNMNVGKHANPFGIDTKWKLITEFYNTNENSGKQLVEKLNDLANNKDFTGIHFEYKNGTIISDTAYANNMPNFIEELWKKIKAPEKDSWGNFKINQDILNTYEFLQENNMAVVSLQRMNMNEHVADFMKMDSRLEQAIRNRSLESGNNLNDLWMDDIKEYARTFTGKADFKAEGDTTLSAFDKYIQSINHTRISNAKNKEYMEKSIKGSFESLSYFYNPELYVENQSNVVKMNMQQLSGVTSITGGVSVKDMHTTAFFVDGKPSNLLEELAKKQNVYLKTSNSIYLDLGQEFNVGEKTVTGLLVPIQNAISSIDDKAFFQNSQKNLAHFINQYNALLNSGNMNKANLSELVKSYMQTIAEQLSYQNKDSDFYKTVHKIIMPNSGGYLAGQESPAIFSEMIEDKTLQELLEKQALIQKNITNNMYTGQSLLDAIKDLDGISEQIKNINEDYAKKILNTEKTSSKGFLELASLKGTKLEGITREEIIKGINDKIVEYGYVVGTSEKAFEAAGLNFGRTAYDLIYDFEQNGGKNIPGRAGKKFNMSSKGYQENIRKKLIRLGKKDDDFKVFLELRQKDKKITDITEKFFSIKNLNEQTIENAKTEKILNIFKNSDLAQDFMSQIGIFGEAPRYPIFRSQSMARWILDRTVEGLQQNIYLPTGSSLNHVDFDGDLLYSIFRLNGGSVLLKNTQAYKNAENAYFSTLGVNRQLLAELIKDGSSLNASDINNYKQQGAQVLEKFFTEDYEQQAISIAKNLEFKDIEGNIITKMSQLTNAQKYVIDTSDEMFHKYLGMNINTLTDERIVKASLAPNLRKLNIGSISTPGFTLRDTVRTLISERKELGEDVQELEGFLKALTNMGSKKGGFLDLAEQGGIDTKHVWDALSTAETVKFSSGLNILYSGRPYYKNRQKLTQKEIQELGLTQITSSLYRSDLFEKSRNAGQSVENIVKEVMEHIDDVAYFNDEIKDTSSKLGLRAFAKLQNYQDISKYWNDALRKNSGTLDSEVAKFFREYLDFDKIQRRKGTNVYEFIKIAQHEVDEKLKFSDKQKIWFSIGDVTAQSEDWKDYIYKYSGIEQSKNEVSVTFNRYALNKATQNFEENSPLVVKGKDLKIVNAQLEKIFKELKKNDKDAYSFTNAQLFHASDSNLIQKELQGTLGQERDAKILDYIFFSKQRKINTPEQAHANLNHINNILSTNNKKIQNAINKKYGLDSFSDIQSAFVKSSGTDKTTNKIFSNIAETIKGYEYARANKPNLISSNELLEQINRGVAFRKEDYFKKTGAGWLEDYDKIVYSAFEKALDGQGVGTLNANIEALNTTGFTFQDIAKYNEATNRLNGTLYDIIDEQDKLKAAYSALDKDYGKSNIPNVTKHLSRKDTALKNIETDILSSNENIISAVEKDIYGLFDKNNYKKQMDTFFKWQDNIGNASSKVAFGAYFGKSFSELNDADIQKILNENRQGLTEINQYAYDKTRALLTEFYKDKSNIKVGQSALTYAKTSDTLRKEIELTTGVAKEAEAIVMARDILEDEAKKIADANKAANKGIKRKTIRGLVFENATDALGKIPWKGVAAIGGSLAALGIANNVIHNQKVQSPLSPARNQNGIGNTPSMSAPGGPVTAPPTPKTKRVVYHDNQSGFNFKVSAKTRQSMDTQSYGSAISQAGGGNATVNIQNDNSKITDNWLANKFAELSM